VVGCEPVAHELQELSQFYGIGGIQAGTGHRDLSGRLARPACCQLFVDIAGGLVVLAARVLAGLVSQETAGDERVLARCGAGQAEHQGLVQRIARAVSASWSTRSRRMRSMLMLCRCNGRSWTWDLAIGAAGGGELPLLSALSRQWRAAVAASHRREDVSAARLALGGR
jgi:hypothetical protein